MSMNKELVKSVFLMFTRRFDATPFLFFTDTAIEKVTSLIKPEYKDNIPDSVHAFAAAVAAEMLSISVCAGDNTICTELGEAVTQRDTENLMKSAQFQKNYWLGVAAPYLTDQAFVIMQTKGGCCE